MAHVKGRWGGARRGAGRPTTKVADARRMEVYISQRVYQQLLDMTRKLGKATGSEYQSDDALFYASTLLERAIQWEAVRLSGQLE